MTNACIYSVLLGFDLKSRSSWGRERNSMGLLFIPHDYSVVKELKLKKSAWLIVWQNGKIADNRFLSSLFISLFQRSFASFSQSPSRGKKMTHALTLSNLSHPLLSAIHHNTLAWGCQDPASAFLSFSYSPKALYHIRLAVWHKPTRRPIAAPLG